jgi:peroxiredoxin
MGKSSLLIVLIAAAFVGQPAFAAETTVNDFTLPSATDGTLIRLADHAGKVVLINWWRTDCGWSQRESPKLVSLYQKYRDKGLVILGVSDDTANTVSRIPAYLKQYGITWPVGLNDQGEFMLEIRSKGKGDTPGNYLVTRSGKLTYLGLDRKP